jgi:hypothetical protein
MCWIWIFLNLGDIETMHNKINSVTKYDEDDVGSKNVYLTHLLNPTGQNPNP